jgi:uncharacterized membrane protein YqjE
MPDHDGRTDMRERPVGELLKELSSETTTLVRKELELAKAEMADKGKRAGLGLGMLGGAGTAALLALGALTAALIAALATGMPTWLAALITAVLWTAAAGVLAVMGREKVQSAAPAAPEQAIANVKEDVQWAKTRTQSARR